MAMAMTEAHERRWINTTWELQQQQNPENPQGMRDGEAGAGAGADYGSALLSSRVDWELKDWESITLAYPTSDENCCSSSSLPETVMVSAGVVKSEPQAEVEESEEEEEEEEEEEVVHQAPEAAAAAPLKLGLKLGRRSSSSSSTEKNKKEKSVSQGSCSTTTPTAVIAPPPAAVAVAVAAGSSSSSPPSTKKQRVTSPSSAAAAGGGGGIQNPAPPPRCQVEGCTADLSSAKDYHRRHKVCEMHSKASKAIAAGREQRFCQQCSRFHVLTEFDEIKRSCRRRLAGHNERRRKPHLESSSSAAAAAAAASNLSFNCRISSPMRSTDAFHIHGTAADSLSLDDCKQTQFLEQIQGSQGGGQPLSSPDLHDDDEHSNHHHPFANVLNLSSPWRPGENVRSPQHIQQVEEKEGQLIMLDRHYGTPSSNRLLMFLQSPRGQMRGALDPSPDVGLSNLSPLVVGGGGSSQEFVDGAKGSLCQNLSLGGGGGWENNNHHNYHHNQGCESQSSGCALSLLSWGTTPCPPALDLCVDNTSLDHHHHHQLVADNNMGSNTVASFATHHLPQQQSQEHYLAFEKLFSKQSGGLGAMGISDIRITDIQQQPLEQSQLHGVGGGGGGGDDGASGNFLSYLGGLGLDAGNSMLALFQSSHDLQGMRSGVPSAHQSLKVTSDLVCTPSLQVHQQHHLHQVHTTTTTSVHSQMQTSFNGGGGEYGEFGPPLHAFESSLFSTQHML